MGGAGAVGAGGGGGGAAGSGGMGWPARTMVTRLMQDRGDGLVVVVAFDAGDGGDHQDGVGVALAEDGVLAVELGDGVLGDEELGAVGVGAGVGHGEASGDGEGERGIELIVEVVAGVAGAVARRVATLDHEAGDDAMEGESVVEALAVVLDGAGAAGPVLGAFGEADEVGDGVGGLLIEGLAGEPAHAGVDDDGRTGGHRFGFGLGRRRRAHRGGRPGGADLGEGRSGQREEEVERTAQRSGCANQSLRRRLGRTGKFRGCGHRE